MIVMKKIYILYLTVICLVIVSCSNGNESNHPVTDSVSSPASSSPDSAANNGILPPSGDPANAGNSSLADSSYPAKDSGKTK
jgi:hypothetical protein